MNKLIEHSHLPRALSGNITFGFLAALNIQRVITVSALLLLLVAVQVSTQSIGDWYVFGLNVLEMTTPVTPLTPVFTEVSNVTTGLNTDLGSGLGSALSAGLTIDSDIANIFTDIGNFTQKFVIGIIECALD
ncbi:hypothetical protein MK852_11575 [Shewanella benthica]|uniref:hypothetical protein n=1 Tax=Shewanella benthica TaxID=43661 RepID=UPI001879305B|nr:hypothetical protein [Shewanella benthica]MBE7215725.1 hypothetical protein [Shewanella benthica]MCL1062769.1 hypothetical protein [Shewanella benthica]